MQQGHVDLFVNPSETPPARCSGVLETPSRNGNAAASARQRSNANTGWSDANSTCPRVFMNWTRGQMLRVRGRHHAIRVLSGNRIASPHGSAPCATISTSSGKKRQTSRAGARLGGHGRREYPY
jgi:hypothetical protein